MPSVTITGTLKNAIRNTAYRTTNTVDVSLPSAFGVDDVGYTPISRSYKATTDGINGSGGFTVTVDDDAPTEFNITFPDATTATVSVDGADSTQTLEDLLSEGGDAPTGSTILVQGTIEDTFTGAVLTKMRIEIALIERFATEDGVYLPVSEDFAMTDEGINTRATDSIAGVTLYVPTGIRSDWRFRFYESFAPDAPLLWTETVYLDDSLSTVEIADVLDGVYRTWEEPAAVPAAPSGVTAIPTGANLDDVLVSWTDNSSDETGFEIQYSVNNSSWSTLTTTAANATSYTHTSPTLGEVTHYYRIRAVNGNGESVWATAQLAGQILAASFYAKLNEASGNRSTAISGLTLTDNNTVGSTTGKLGNAALFAATNSEYMSVANNAALNIGAGNFTLRTWAEADTAQDDTYIAVVGKDDFSIGPREWLLQFISADGHFIFSLFDASDNAAGVVESATGITRDVFHHVVVWRNGSTLYMSIDNNTPTTGTITGTPRSSSSAAFTIGGMTNYADGFLNGKVDDTIIIKGRYWSDAERTDDHNSGNGRAY